MSEPAPISKEQLKRLHVLWRSSSAETNDREQRLAWASRNIHRDIDSFKELTSAEANSLGDILDADYRRAIEIDDLRDERRAAQCKSLAELHEFCKE